ncbi:hypothetical protein I7X12_07860 [Halosimplex litoreum]|uniref:Uncharacterized protein n=1 Tax=Halosimplex litoreum TaxID=1198301 RepID=A0A7T3G1B1_9EURY|nr:hypothetical protein [Halosimplex litoreum]QPV64516.1 hypothetical protein I7X12_07860 [Halosimplex litoreum]
MDYEDLNHLPARRLVGQVTDVVIVPIGAYYSARDDWEMVRVEFVDGDSEKRSFSAFRGSCSAEAWDELVRLVQEWDELWAGDRTLFVTDVRGTVNDEYLNLNPTGSSEVVVGRVGEVLRERGYLG